VYQSQQAPANSCFHNQNNQIGMGLETLSADSVMKVLESMNTNWLLDGVNMHTKTEIDLGYFCSYNYHSSGRLIL